MYALDEKEDIAPPVVEDNGEGEKLLDAALRELFGDAKDYEFDESTEIKLSKYEHYPYHRPLSKYESRVNFAKAEESFASLIAITNGKLREILREIQKSVIQHVSESLGNMAPQAAGSFRVDVGQKFYDAFREFLLSAWRDGKDHGYDELPASIKNLVRQVKTFDAHEYAADWDEDKHPRQPEGSSEGGQFAPSEGSDLFGEWGASLKDENIVIGFRAEAAGGTNLGKMAGTEGVGLYIAKTPETAEFFGKAKQISFSRPKNPLVVDEEPLHILHETDALLEPPSESDSPWLAANKEAIKRSGTTNENWGEKTKGELQDALTDVLRERGHDAVYVKSGGEEWIVLIPPKKGQRIKFTLDAESHEYAEWNEEDHPRGYAGFEPRQAIDYLTTKALVIKGLLDNELTEDVRQLLLEHLKGGRTLSETIMDLREMFEPWIGDPTKIAPSGQIGVNTPPGTKSPDNILQAYRLENMIRTPLNDAYNQGRLAIGDAAEDYVIGYQYSAILDSRTTKICEENDGLTIRAEDFRLRKLQPPCHFSCRSMLVYVTIDDAPIEWSDDGEIDDAVDRIQEGFS